MDLREVLPESIAPSSRRRRDGQREKEEIIKLAEVKRQEIIESDKFLSGTKNYKHHPESFYTSRLLNESIEQIVSAYYISDGCWW